MTRQHHPDDLKAAALAWCKSSQHPRLKGLHPCSTACDACIHSMGHALTAIAEAQERRGMVLVPLEPTDAMAAKGEYVNSEWLNDRAPIGQGRYRRPALAVYEAMIAARPTYPTPATEREDND